MRALEGMKILDLTRIGPGPFCTWILADLGAEVIKVEAPPAAGTREAGLFQLIIGKADARALAHWVANRNKKSIGINLKTEAGRQIFSQLAKEADVIVEGFRPGVAKRLGIDYEAVSTVNPGIVYCSITGYGQDGPYRNMPGHDINYISLSGALSLIGRADEAPIVPVNLLGDFGGSGMSAVIGILSAIIARGKTGKGQYIDISMMDSVITLLADTTSSYFQSGTTPERGKMALGGAYPYYNVYQTKDKKFITIGCLEPAFWEKLCKVIGKEEYIPFGYELDHNFLPPQGGKWQEISAFLRQTFLTRTRDEWFDFLVENDIPAGKVYSLDEVFNDPQVLHRKMVVEVEHPSAGKVKQIGISVKLSDTPGEVRTSPPAPGENTGEILRKLGYSPESIDSLRKSGVVS